ncbi:40S ribosomal protein S13 [Sesamum alatum]|uniref:40S ribosomal protein S13 n=1 Tax=Sesamum alatum TaxID=300844 RepID=A0AAE1YKC2_9LAMI|nr:40S ribosomal protein S13 [Sesamum alatum]
MGLDLFNFTIEGSKPQYDPSIVQHFWLKSIGPAHKYPSPIDRRPISTQHYDKTLIIDPFPGARVCGLWFQEQQHFISTDRAAPPPSPPWVLPIDSPASYFSKGISASALPYKRTPPSWLKISSQDVEDNICKFAKRGMTPSQIGVILRDSHGIAQVKSVTGSKILRILKAHGLAPEIPEDLYHLIKKAVAIRKHLERNRKDKDSKFRLILVESRIHRLARYYKKTKKLPPVWKYESTTASTLVA